MKKLLFTAYTLDLGGIETALVTLLNELVNKYNITLVLEKKQGIFLDELSDKVKIIEYTPSSSKNVVIRKIQNLIKQIQFKIKYKNKYDFSASFATYSGPGSFCARTASKNSALWAHADYLAMFNNDKKEVTKFFKFVKYNEFRRIVFVSEEGKNTFLQVFPQMNGKVIKCNNAINYQKIEKLSKESIEEKKDDIYTILNVGRHDEKQKKLTRLLEAAYMLKKDKFSFKIILVGNGPDTDFYKKIVKEKNLEDIVYFVGAKKNPYPYFKIADSIILTSEYEGYPVTIIESLVLNKPVITTKVSDVEEDISGKFGYVTTKEINSIYEAMKKIITEGYNIEQSFDSKQFNKNIISTIERIIEGEL